MAFGLSVWADAWTYSPLALNAFKCTLGSALFGVVVLIFYRRPMPGRAVLWLAFSSLLGIVIADTLWLAALQILGARRMIAIDALKPFVAAFMGYFLLGDAVPWLGYLGVVICALGVYLLNVESAAKEDDVDGDAPPPPTADARSSPRRDAAARGPDVVEAETEPPYLRGYAYATVNVVLDVYAATITVAERGPLSSAEVNLLRFGLAAVLLILVWVLREGRLKSDAKPMPRRDWMRVALGVVFVTFLTPLITVWTMFVLPLAVAVTLWSLTPLWALPVSAYFGQRVSRRALMGAFLATGGVVMLAVAVT
jgi:drug/metabolite transporter (DMT)-like permease